MEFQIIFYTIIFAAFIMFFTFLSPLNDKGKNITGLLFILFTFFFTLSGFKLILDLYSNRENDTLKFNLNLVSEDIFGNNIIGKVYNSPIVYFLSIFGLILFSYFYSLDRLDERALITYIVIFCFFMGSFAFDDNNVPFYILYGVPVVMIFISLILILNTIVKLYYSEKRRLNAKKNNPNRKTSIKDSDMINFRIFYSIDGLTKKMNQFMDEYKHFLVSSIIFIIIGLLSPIIYNEKFIKPKISEKNFDHFNLIIIFAVYLTSSFTLGKSVSINNRAKTDFRGANNYNNIE